MIQNLQGRFTVFILLFFFLASSNSKAANYNMSNGSITVCSGNSFYDSGGSSSNYGNNESFTYTINPATAGQYVQVNFSSFQTEALTDFLTIYDGTSTSAPVISSYSGNTSPGIITARNSSGALTFVFTSNANTVSTGWVASISCVASKTTSSSANFVMTNNAKDTVSAGTFYDAGGSGNYGNNESKTMTIYPETAGQYVQLAFSSFGSETATDYLTVYDGTSTSAPIISSYSGNNSPGTISARNNSGALTLVFTSNANTISNGWAATITNIASKSSSASGNYLMTNNAVDTLSAGTFYDSGGSASNYSNSETKTMTIYPATAGQYLKLIFTSFQTEAATDFFTIYDGSSTAAPVFSTYSGNGSPDTIVARNAAGCLTIRFTSNANTPALGWAATISCSATAGSNSGTYLMTTTADTVCGGRFYDSGHSGNYSANENSVMTFYPSSSGQYVSLTFSSFQTEQFTDFMYIYDGPDITSPIIGVYSGFTSPNVIAARNTSGCLTIKFTSNGNTQSGGWLATLGCSSTPGTSSGNYPISNAANITTCGGNFYDSGGTASNYDANESSTTTLYPSTTGQYVVLTFSSFQTEQFTDYMYIYDGTSTSSPLIGIYSGNTTPGTIGARNASGSLTVKFTSNGNTQSTGWAATISCSASPGSSAGIYPMSPGAVVTTCSGTFYDSGGSGAAHDKNENYTMTFYPETAGNYVKLAFTGFQIEYATDYLYLYDGTSASAPLIGIYTGNTSPDTIVARNSTGALTFVFTSNGSVQNFGWAATISCSSTAGTIYGAYPMTNNAVDTVCGGTFYDMGGSTASYSNSETKTMTFYPSTAGQYLSVNFTSFQTEAATDYLYVYDGTSTSASLIGMFSGLTGPCTMYATNAAGALTFKFTSNGSVNSTGWAATLSCVSSYCSNAGCYLMTNGATIHAGGGTFYDSGGSSGQYSASETSTMTFYPTSGLAIQMAFSSFATEATNDKLFIYDGPNTSSTLLGTYSGNTSPGTFTATNGSGCLTVKFTSNGNNQNNGWVASISNTGTTTWSGASSTDWSSSSNWADACAAPSCAVNVNIPFTSLFPTISSNTNVKNLNVASGVTLTISSGTTVTVCGDFTNSGTIAMATGATLLFNNGSVVQNISGTLTGSNAVGNIVITKTGGSVVVGSDIEIKGNLTTSNSTSILNTGGRYLKLGGNLINSSGETTFSSSGTTGTLEFNGTSAQTFTPGGTINLNNVKINNAAGVTLSGDLNMGSSGILTMTNGVLSAGSNKVIIGNSSSSAISGINALSYVDGILQRALNGAATSYDFPVGSATKGFQKVNVTFTTPTTIPALKVDFSPYVTVPNGPSAPDCPNADFSTNPALNNGYWEITPTANPTSGNFDITLYSTNYNNQSSNRGWSVMRANDINSTWGFTGTCVMTNTVTQARRTGVNGFGVFGIAQTGGALPVELIYFSGENKDGKNLISWVTATEKNNDFFTLEKSEDGKEFEYLGKIKGAGTTKLQQTYNFTDNTPTGEITYYRLTQTDFDGHFKVFKAIFIKNTEKGNCELFPNPTNGYLNLSYKGNDGDQIEINVISMTGAIVYRTNADAGSGFYSGEINLSQYQPGEYLVRLIIGGDKVINQKIVLRK